MNIALVHDYLREYGGAERVLEAMHEIWPHAPLYTSFVDWDSLGEHAKRFQTWDIRPSWVQQNWIVKRFHSPLRFLAPRIWRSLDLSGFDVVLSSSGWYMCRGVIVRNPAVHICYIHHPPRNLYGYATGSTLQKYWPVRAYASIVNFFLRQYDFETAQEVDWFIANSQETARRVKKFYRRDSVVIYPPIEIDESNHANQSSQKRSAARAQDRTYFLSVGRLTYSKRIDIIIEACNRLKLPLKIVGAGKEEHYLRSLAGPTIEFMGSVSDAALAQLYRQAKALLFCALDEDFGMVPVESMAYGTPVIALNQGGVKETVVDGKTGILFSDPSVDALSDALRRFTKSTVSWGEHCTMHAKKFRKDRFQKELSQFVSVHLPS